MAGKAAHKPQPRVLLVDDDRDQLALCSHWLTGADYRVDTALGAAEALASLGQARPDLVITDLIMDAKDGLYLPGEIARSSIACWPVTGSTRVLSAESKTKTSGMLSACPP